MNSLELTRTLYRDGILSKEAAIGVMRERDNLINKALFSESVSFFKEAGLLSDFMGKLRIGGRTPIQGAKGAPRIISNWSDLGANLTKILALAGLASASTAGVHAIGMHLKDRKLQKDIEKSFVQMKSQFPRISEMDQDKVRNHFNVLSQFAPSLAANPTIAGGFILTEVSRGIVNPATISTLVKSQETIDKIHGLHSEHGLPLQHASRLAQTVFNS